MKVRRFGRLSSGLAPAALALVAEAQVLSRESFGTGCQPADAGCAYARLSPSGRWVLFSTPASNLVPNDANGTHDVFLRDRSNRTTECLSVDPSGNPGNGLSVSLGGITSDGRYVAFESSASNLVPGDTNGTTDVFVRDRVLGTTVRVSVATGGAQSNGYCGGASLSDDGRFVGYCSDATSLVPGDAGSQFDVFFHDRDPDVDQVFDEGNGTTICLSVDPTTGNPTNGLSTGPQLSADGRYVAFDSWKDGVVPGDANLAPDVLLWDRSSGAVVLLSLDSSGNQANNTSTRVSLSADGLHATFASIATNLDGSDTNGIWDVYARDWQAGVTELVSIGTDYHGSYISMISGDGRFVAFETQASLLPADTDFDYDVYLRDRQSGTTTLLTGQTNGGCFDPSITPDGSFVAWDASLGMLPGDVNDFHDVYVLDRGGVQPVYADFCYGDGTGAACPCGNSGIPGRGCAHSQGAAARLEPHGTTQPDKVILAVHGEIASALTIFLQGTASIAPTTFGDGLRCVGGSLKRLNATNAWSGSAYFPACPFPLSITARSAQLGDPLGPGSVRHYMTYYRDGSTTFCPAPIGNTWNGSQAISLTW